MKHNPDAVVLKIYIYKIMCFWPILRLQIHYLFPRSKLINLYMQASNKLCNTVNFRSQSSTVIMIGIYLSLDHVCHKYCNLIG